MKNKTKENIYEFIQKNGGASAKDIIGYLHHNPTGVFKHLQTLQKQSLVYKIGKPPKVRYYASVPAMENTPKITTEAINWAVSGDTRLAPPEILCQTRDVFQARTDRLVNDLKKNIKNDNLVYILVAAVGEIGNNSFDHNLGHWHDAPGVFFRIDDSSRAIILADRGQGVFATIQKVRPHVADDVSALQVAFTEMVSGRAPEKRGNGLKFVKKVIEENQLHLIFYSGEAMAEITRTGITIKKSDIKIPGTLAHIQF